MIKFLEETTSKKPSEIFTNQDVAWPPPLRLFHAGTLSRRMLVATGAQYDRLKKDTHDDERDDDISVADSHDTFAESHEPNATDAIVVVRRCRAPALRHSLQHAGSFAERHGTASCASHAATPSLATDRIESHTTQTPCTRHARLFHTFTRTLRQSVSHMGAAERHPARLLRRDGSPPPAARTAVLQLRAQILRNPRQNRPLPPPAVRSSEHSLCRFACVRACVRAC